MKRTRRSFLSQGAAAGLGLLAAGTLDRAAAQRAIERDFGNLKLGIAVNDTSLDAARAEADWAKKAGFDRVQLNLRMPDVTPEEFAQLCEIHAERDLQIVALGCYVNPLDPGNRDYMGFSIEAMRVAAECPATPEGLALVSWSGGYHDRFGAGDDRNASGAAMDELVRGTDHLLDVLAPCKGRVAYEPYHPDILGTPRRYAELFRRVRTSRVGIAMDPANFVTADQFLRRSQIMSEAFDLLDRRVILAHLKDIDMNAEGGITLPGPCDGKQNYDLFLTRLASLGRPVDCILEHTSGEGFIRSRDLVLKAIDRAASLA